MSMFPPGGGQRGVLAPLSANPACAATSRGDFRFGELITESVSCKSFVEPQIIEICENIHSQRDSKPLGGSPDQVSFLEGSAWIASVGAISPFASEGTTPSAYACSADTSDTVICVLPLLEVGAPFRLWGPYPPTQLDQPGLDQAHEIVTTGLGSTGRASLHQPGLHHTGWQQGAKEACPLFVD